MEFFVYLFFDVVSVAQLLGNLSPHQGAHVVVLPPKQELFYRRPFPKPVQFDYSHFLFPLVIVILLQHRQVPEDGGCYPDHFRKVFLLGAIEQKIVVFGCQSLVGQPC